ncbi:hypothetical protein LTR78_004616 [Recurvomyces mirabilis]|uniref:Beta-lactamase-related domain-containing protein n=1 Tax=Recurvomyces mirabilis TaxID=574656 RepID=A0AAE1C2J0_9PEZI|nr:hypothetical protein LTR78_004616 [Recurvomyces mirabilis]KAK5152890.1 hypothetical protein LTS14_007998 [Recurvomyces mirabilis]
MPVNLSNWREAPHNVWGFIHVEELLMTQPIWKGTSLKELPTGEHNAFDGFDVKSMNLMALLDYTHTDGFIVLHKGKIIHEHYTNDNDASSKHIMFSMTKSVTGLIAGILHQEGKLDLKAEVKDYVAEVSRLYDGVTVQQCLDMQTGVKYDDNKHEYRAACGWEPLDGSEKCKTLREFLQHVEAPVDETKGFNYCSVNTDLLGLVIEKVTNRKLPELIQELLWQPMGADSNAAITIDSEGSPRAAGGMCATLRDIARIGQLLTDSGRGIVPKSWIDEILNGGNDEKFTKGQWSPAFKPSFETPAYHNCWVTDPGTKTLVALGVFGQQLMIDLEHDIVMAKTSSQLTSSEFDKMMLGSAAFREIQRILGV